MPRQQERTEPKKSIFSKRAAGELKKVKTEKPNLDEYTCKALAFNRTAKALLEEFKGNHEDPKILKEIKELINDTELVKMISDSYKTIKKNFESGESREALKGIINAFHRILSREVVDRIYSKK